MKKYVSFIYAVFFLLIGITVAAPAVIALLKALLIVAASIVLLGALGFGSWRLYIALRDSGRLNRVPFISDTGRFDP